MTDAPNRFIFSDRDYLSLRDQLTEYIRTRIPDWIPGDVEDGVQGNPSDFSTVFVEAVAYMGDLLSYYNDRAAQEATPVTANSLSNILAWADLFGFTPALAKSAEVVVRITNNKADEAEIPNRLPLRSTTGYGFEVMLKPDDSGVVPDSVTLAPNEEKEFTAWEGRTVYSEGIRGVPLGISDGTQGQEYVLPDGNVDSRELWVDVYLDDIAGPISTGVWLQTFRLLEHESEDTVFSTRLGKDRRLHIVFGDGVNGMVPPKGYNIRAYYRTTVGAAANDPAAVPPFSISMVDTSWEMLDMASLSSLRVENPESPSGGVDPDSSDIIKRKTAAVASAQRRAVTRDDYEAAALMHGELLRAYCTAEVWSRPIVWVLPKSRSVYEQRSVKRDLIASVSEMLQGLSMIGAHPHVQLGMPVPLNLELNVYTYKNIRHSAVENAIKSAVTQEFSYDKLRFERGIGSEDVLNAISQHVATRMVRFVVPKLTATYPKQPVASDPSLQGDCLADQRFLPRIGELLYIDADTLVINVQGGINDLRQP